MTMHRFRLLVGLFIAALVAFALATNLTAAQGEAGGGGGGGGVGGFGPCVECNTVAFILHCDYLEDPEGDVDAIVDVSDVAHPCPELWAGSCTSEHMTCGETQAMTEFDPHWVQGVLAGATKSGVCWKKYEGRVA